MPYTNATAVGPLNAKVIVARGVLRLMLFLAAPLIALVQVPAPRADSASCLAKATLFVTELDELLEKEKEWDTPYPDLVKRYFPLRDCEAQAFWMSADNRALFGRLPHQRVFHQVRT
jgi:hypothetical protein